MSLHISPHDAHDDPHTGSHNGLHRDLVAKLAADGVLPEEWRPAFEATARHRFIPAVIWVGEDLEPLALTDDPDGWMAAAYADAPVVTQVDDGIHAGGGAAGRYSTSSASMPTAVAAMLGHLDVRAGLRVLEIGTGTGPQRCPARAPARRRERGHRRGRSGPGRGGQGGARRHRPSPSGGRRRRRRGLAGRGAPYDRVISTAAVETVPYAWVEQTRPGGLVLTPWGNRFYNGSLLRLDVNGDTATGRIVDNAAFMHLRQQRWPLLDTAAALDGTTATAAAASTVTSVHPWYVTGEDGALLAIGHRVPDCTRFADPGADGEVVIWFADHDGGSWATLRYVPDATEFEVHQAGPRHLWNEVGAAYHWWRAAGAPGPNRYGITITPDGQTTWLDTSDHHVASPM